LGHNVLSRQEGICVVNLTPVGTIALDKLFER